MSSLRSFMNFSGMRYPSLLKSGLGNCGVIVPSQLPPRGVSQRGSIAVHGAGKGEVVLILCSLALAWANTDMTSAAVIIRSWGLGRCPGC